VTDSSRVAIARTMAAVAVVGAVVGLAWVSILGMTEALWSDWLVHNGLIAVGSGVIAWTVAPGQPRNSEVWVFAWAGLFTGLLCLTYGVAAQTLIEAGSVVTSLYDLTPAEAPLPGALLLMPLNFLWIGVFGPLTLGWVLFPDGRPPSARWRGLVVAATASLSVLGLGLLWVSRPTSTLPLGTSQTFSGEFAEPGLAVVGISYLLTLALVPVCAAALLVRSRKTTGTERQQFRWVVWGAAVAGLMMVAAGVQETIGSLDAALAFGLVAMAVFIASFGVAIGRYKLYEIDTVISRTLVYGALALFIGAVYVGIVVGVGRLVGSGDQPNIWLEVLATVVIAIAFQPLRRRLQRLANRVVYGRRATPYEVLSTFSRRVSSVDSEVLAQVARSLAEGTTAGSASIWARGDGMPRQIAVWPASSTSHAIEPDEDGSLRTAEVLHNGEELGFVALRVEPGQPFAESDQRLLDQVAGGLGLALRNLQLTEDLKARVEELAASRRRIVAVQDETRRKLERDLHDGAQQRLVALKIKLGIGAGIAQKAGLDDVRSMLETVKAETDQTIDSVRDFARGIYPPLLEAEGLGTALSAQARKMPIQVTVQAVAVGRHPKEQEATIYFCVLEALQNAMKHSGASSVQVLLTETSSEITFEVRDDGVGFDASKPSGSGMTHMVDRVEAVGGTLVVASAPGRGTTVTGRLPVSELVAT
jgi:signal transduction histidine kinase